MIEEQRAVRITTWNVNGIRNPFGYQPWRQERTFAAMFDILEADIVVMQETKIQRKDLRDDMVLVPGWDVFFSLPKHKKGYSGVAIYTRNSVCAPIRAEEGITGILTPPNSTTSFCDLPSSEQIGGYPTPYQLSQCALDAATLDSEGRCMILEFPAFVLIGTYCPATRDESRDEFRIGFLDALDARVRNLVARGKRVFLTGDLNIMREELDTANVDEMLKKRGVTVEEFFSSSSRKMLNQLLVGGKVYGEKEEGREEPVMWDICRGFHPTRKGMFTCWEQKINARPGNFGSRIDYVLCSEGWKDWFSESNIQEGLMGSDHCPVYAVLKDKVELEGQKVDIRDIMSHGMFKGGVRQREWSTKDLLPLSAKLIPQFDRRRSIRDMFARKPSLPAKGSVLRIHDRDRQQTVPLSPQDQPGVNSEHKETDDEERQSQMENSSHDSQDVADLPREDTSIPTQQNPALGRTSTKRSAETVSSISQKRGRTAGKALKAQTVKGQSSLTGFFKPKVTASETANSRGSEDQPRTPNKSNVEHGNLSSSIQSDDSSSDATKANDRLHSASHDTFFEASVDDKPLVDPIVAKESWSRLLSKRVVPRCEHNEPCISLVTKKAGVNCGRSFFMCPRPLGPSGQKEKNTQWRCGTFVWSSDWTKDAT